MGRELQKRKRRSSRAKVTMPARRKKVLNPMGSGIIAQNWDKKETLSQNYNRFGIVARLGHTAGGTANRKKTDKSQPAGGGGASAADPLVYTSRDRGLLQVREVKVERDADGRIVRVLREANPLHDPLNDLEEESEGEDEMADDGEEWGGIDQRDRPHVIRELEREAARPVEKTVRHQSEREREWLVRLTERHGSDTAAMARDSRLNPMQQTAKDIAKRLRKAGLLAGEST